MAGAGDASSTRALARLTGRSKYGGALRYRYAVWMALILCAVPPGAARADEYAVDCPAASNAQFGRIAYTYHAPHAIYPAHIRFTRDAQVAEYDLRLPHGAGIFDAHIPRIGFVPQKYAIVGNDERLTIDSVSCLPTGAGNGADGQADASVDNGADGLAGAPPGSGADRQAGASANNGADRRGADIRNALVHVDIDTLIALGRTPMAGADYALYAWHYYPRILIVDTANYHTLSLFFKRLAFFIEKDGYSGTIREEGDLAGRYAWRGHNYDGEGLALFYNHITAQDGALNRHETRLLNIAVAYGIIAQRDGIYYPGDGGILGISRESPPYTRAAITRHEFLHGAFYSSPPFRTAAYEHWMTLSPNQMRAWQEVLRALTYDPERAYLVINEMQAYLLAKPLPESVAQMAGVARRLSTNDALAPIMRSLLRDNNAPLRHSAEHLDAALLTHTGLTAGLLTTFSRR